MIFSLLIIVLGLGAASPHMVSITKNNVDIRHKAQDYASDHARKTFRTNSQKLQQRSPMDQGGHSGGHNGGDHEDHDFNGNYLTNDPSYLDNPGELVEVFGPHEDGQLFGEIPNRQLGALGEFDPYRRNPWLFQGARHFRASGRTAPWQFRVTPAGSHAQAQGLQARTHFQDNFPIMVSGIGRIGTIHLRYDTVTNVAITRFFVDNDAILGEWFAARGSHLVSFLLVYGMVRMDVAQFIPPVQTQLDFLPGERQTQHYDNSRLYRSNRVGRWPGYSVQPPMMQQHPRTDNIHYTERITVPVRARYNLEGLRMMLFQPSFRMYWSILVVEFALNQPQRAPRGRAGHSGGSSTRGG